MWRIYVTYSYDLIVSDIWNFSFSLLYFWSFFHQMLSDSSSPTEDWGPANSGNRLGTMYETENSRDHENGTANNGYVTSNDEIPSYDDISKL